MSYVAEIIRQAAARYQQSPEAMLRIAQIESGLNPNAVNRHSGATGVFQFIPSTWRQYGNGANATDAAANIDAAMRFTRDNQQRFRAQLGREPNAGEIYLMHQQGAGGALKLLSNPDAPAVSIVGRDAVRLNGGHEGMTARDFAAMWMAKANGTGSIGQNSPQTAQNAPAAPQIDFAATMPPQVAQNASPLAAVFANAPQKAPVRRKYDLDAVLNATA